MDNRIKVLHYTPGFDHGGIESRLIDWYKNIDRNMVQFDLIKLTTADDNNQLIRDFKDLGGKVFTLPQFSFESIKPFMRGLRDFFEHNNDYDVIHCHSPLSGSFVLREAKKYNIPVRIMHSRTTQFDPGSKLLPIRKYLKNRSNKYATHFFACSKEAGEWQFGKKNVNDGNVKIIKNGIQSEKFIFNEEIRQKTRQALKLNKTFTIGHIGRFSSVKNHTFLIDVFKEITRRYEDSKLLLIGDGPEEFNIKQKVRNLNIDDKVIFLGRQKEVENYLHSMDVFIFPSIFEGFGTVAIEAQASGLECIVSKGVPFSVDVSNLINHLPLSAGPEEWAEIILQFREGYKRRNMYEVIVKAGFDAKYTAKLLESFYISESESKRI
ncbi:glycosyltransferase family 1 protein [Rossellomorea yichunensis]|uniref:glycosyltransferase family 1 protein n=1 Tax=Rossellomorea yichunensis TaxID=3077331 RepID=UPI0028DE1C3F|nr:glycosyltransferase family 1 protein [Rossellomorea sp. YC4-1]MDT9026819.1 glycosyltransferase family 1 protein [Rossellomorea sp. YC4-1]